MSEAIERARTRDLFARFVPADVVEEVLASTDENLRLGGVQRDCTVLFSDLRGFTTFSETQTPERVIEVVNHYLNEMTEAIMAAGGTLIAYMGDGIMAVFGAPLAQDDHADRALRAAREMLGRRLDRFNDWLAEQGHDHRFAMGVGLNSGPVMAGNVGAEARVEYTAIGDTTNTASRLESMTKDSGTMLFVSQTTRDRMKSPPEDLRRFDELQIRGREARLVVWTLDAHAGRLRAHQPDRLCTRKRPASRSFLPNRRPADAPQELDHLAVVDSLRGRRGEHEDPLRGGHGSLRPAAAGANRGLGAVARRGPLSLRKRAGGMDRDRRQGQHQGLRLQRRRA